MVSISACHADDPGSIPGRGVFASESPSGSGVKAPLAGLEPAIFGLEVRRVIHYAKRASPPGAALILEDASNHAKEDFDHARKNEPRAIRTPNRLIWSQTRYRCAMDPC